MRKILILFIFSFFFFFSGCARVLPGYQPPPPQYEDEVQIPDFPNVRAWGDSFNKNLQKSVMAALDEEKAANGGKLRPEVSGLALSGGGKDGAFGAGFLCGWSKEGSRPSFKIVTGISTGALIAPFAFLGSEYDDKLKKVYTTISDQGIYKIHSITQFLMALINIEPLPSIADSEPLADLIKKEIDQKMLQRIAAEHRKGRRLLVGTTQLNAQRLVIWDMGAIANSNQPGALELFHKVLLASASLPASFPPQYFTVKAGGQLYNEMHVDGGIEAQVMLYENAIQPFATNGQMIDVPHRPRKLYIIRNQKVFGEWEYVEPKLRYIAVRAIDSLTKSQGIGDLYRLYAYTQRDHVDYNLVYIPADFKEKAKTPFDNAYMRKLFDRGYAMGKAGHPWHKYPPDFSPRPHPSLELTSVVAKKA